MINKIQKIIGNFLIYSIGFPIYPFYFISECISKAFEENNMARKFKIGDKIEITQKLGTCEFSTGFRIGSIGTIIHYTNEKEEEYPYAVQNTKGQTDQFKAAELKKK